MFRTVLPNYFSFDAVWNILRLTDLDLYTLAKQWVPFYFLKNSRWGFEKERKRRVPLDGLPSTASE
jgi:hypothetical protein